MYERVRGRWTWLSVFGLVLAAACSDGAQSPVDVSPQFAPGGGGGGPSVDAADPSEAPQDVTLDVRVIGSGFDDGSEVKFLLAGQSTSKIVTNSSTFVSRNEVIANITISADADLALYDIELTTRRGKKGIGSELFAVKPKDDVDPFYQITTFGNGGSQVVDVSDTDVIAGQDGGHAATFDLSGTPTFLPDAGAESSGVFRISSSALYAVGWAHGGPYPGDARVMWDLTTGTISQAPGLPGLEGRIYDINDAGVGTGTLDSFSTSDQWPAIWEPSAPGAWSVRHLPSLPQHTQGFANAINEAGHVVGRSSLALAQESHAVVWIPNGDGTFDVLDLTPLADGSGGNFAGEIAEPDAGGSVLIAGYARISGIRYRVLWTVDLAARDVTEQLTTDTAGGLQDIAANGDVLVGGRVWRPASNTFLELESSGSRCWWDGTAFGSDGRVFGYADVSTRNGDTCSSERHTVRVAAYWTLIGG